VLKPTGYSLFLTPAADLTERCVASTSIVSRAATATAYAHDGSKGFRVCARRRSTWATVQGVMCVMDQLTDVLSAISHPTRRAIIGQLVNGPARFLDIAKPFDTALNAVTKHLKSLERAGLIEDQRVGLPD